jgi:hypothetical protein
MAKKYSDGVENSIKELFYKKAEYVSTTSALPATNLLNYNIGEVGLFGKVNQTFVPVVVKNEYMKTFLGKNAIDRSRPPRALAFVVDIFERMAMQFDKCVEIGRINPHDQFLSNLKVYRAYKDPHLRYNEYLSLLSQTLKNQIRQEKIDIFDFDDFINALMRLLEKGAFTFPFTKTGFIKSRHSSMLSSGLVIEIADMDYNNDQVKIDKFINSPNWDFYVQTCNSYGFVIDGSAPWRLMADLDSVIMKEHASRYGMKGATIVLMMAYDVVSHVYFKERFIGDLLNLYNITKKNFVITPNICKDNTTKISSEKSTTYTSETALREKYSRPYFLKKYFEIRFFEEESQFTEAKKNQIIDNCLYLLESQGYVIAMASFEKIINKPFDYRGSFSYINRQVEVLDERPEGDPREVQRELLRIRNKKN